jgi:hypothetical protein
MQGMKKIEIGGLGAMYVLPLSHYEIAAHFEIEGDLAKYAVVSTAVKAGRYEASGERWLQTELYVDFPVIADLLAEHNVLNKQEKCPETRWGETPLPDYYRILLRGLTNKRQWRSFETFRRNMKDRTLEARRAEAEARVEALAQNPETAAYAASKLKGWMGNLSEYYAKVAEEMFVLNKLPGGGQAFEDISSIRIDEMEEKRADLLKQVKEVDKAIAAEKCRIMATEVGSLELPGSTKAAILARLNEGSGHTRDSFPWVAYV